MDIIKTEQEADILRKEIHELETEMLKLQAKINIKKIQLGRDVELLEIKGIISD